MAWSKLYNEDQKLESDVIQTMMAGFKDFRPDLNYPESYSDMTACVRALLRMFEIKRRPLAEKLRYHCYECEGYGKFVTQVERHSITEKKCVGCNGKGYING